MRAAPVQHGCLQHPDRVADVYCERCSGPMCPRCVHSTKVGLRCPSCVRLDTAGRTKGQKRRERVALEHKPLLTALIIAINLGVFAWDVSQGAGLTSGADSTAAERGQLYGPDVLPAGEWYRVVTSAFVHRGLGHLVFNMWILWNVGQVIEGRFGPLTFASIYGSGIVASSLGAVAIQPEHSVIGASGAVLAVLAAMVVLQYMRGVKILSEGVGPLLVVSVMISFFPGVALGGHFGGIAAGLVAGLMLGVARNSGRQALAVAPLPIAAIGLAALFVLIPAIERAVSLTPTG